MGTAEDVLEIRVTEVIDLASFWAQIGTMKHLLEYDNHQTVISSWCEACTTSSHQSTSHLRPGQIVALQGKTKGAWVRSKVTTITSDRTVELFHVDTGTTEYADISSICAETPPMLCAIPQQALQCVLDGVKQLEGSTEWSKEAESRFSELISVPAKALVHKILQGNCVVVSLFVPYNDRFTSVGEVLRIEELVKYEPCGPLTLSLPIPPELHGTTSLQSMSSVTSVDADCDISLKASTVHETVKRELCFDSQQSSLLSSTPVDAHHEDSPKIPPLREGSIEHGKSSFVPKVLPTAKNVDAAVGGVSTPQEEPSEKDQLLSKADSGVVEEEDAELNKSSSGSSLSDNDWLDEDLLPRRSGTSEVSDVIVESPVKDVEPPEVVPELETDTNKPPRQLSKSNSRPNQLSGGVFRAALRESRQSVWGVTKGRGRRKNQKSEWESKERSWGVMKGRGQQVDNNQPTPSPGRVGQNQTKPGQPFRFHSGLRQPYHYLSGPRLPSPYQDDARRPPPHQGGLNKPSHYQVKPKQLSPYQDKPYQSEPTKPGSDLPPIFPVVPIPPGTAEDTSPRSSSSYIQQIKTMTGQEVADEVKWQEWKLEKELGKILSSLTPETVQNCGEQIEKMLLGSAAEKLQELPMSRKPLEVVAEHLFKETNLNSNLLVAVIGTMMEGSFSEDFCAAFLVVVNEMASRIPESAEKCQDFCHILGSLVTSSSSSNNSKYQDMVVAGVNRCLVTWSEFVSLDSFLSEQQGKCRVDCFISLLTLINLAANKKIWEGSITSLMEGPVKDCVLCDNYPRYIRDAWYMVSTKVIKTLFGDITPPVDSATGENLARSQAIAKAEVPVHEPSKGVVSDVPLQGIELNQQLQQLHSGMELSQQLQPGLELNQQLQPGLERNQHPGVGLSQEQVMMAYSSPVNIIPTQEVPQYHLPGSEVLATADSYTRVVVMLETLHMTELLPKFRAAMIKDSLLNYDIQSINSCLKDAGIPSGAIVEIMHFIGQSRTPKQQHSLLSQPSSPVSPSTNTQLQYYTAPGTMHFASPQLAQQQLQATPYQIPAAHVSTSPAPYVASGVYNAEGMGYAGRKPLSPLTTFQMVPPPPGNKAHVIQPFVSQQQQPLVSQQQTLLTQQQQPPLQQQSLVPQQQQQSLVPQQQQQPKVPQQQTSESKESKATGRYRLNSNPSTPTGTPSVRGTLAAKSSDEDSPTLRLRKPQSSSSQPLPGTPFPTSIRPPTRFGRVTCVVCGSTDHMTPECTQRNKFFTHM